MRPVRTAVRRVGADRARTGDRPHRIAQLWARLKQRLAEDADETFEVPARPTAETEAAFAALAGRGRAPQ